MNTFASFTALGSMLTFLLVPLPATATTITECQGQIFALIVQTQGTAFAGDKNAKEEDKLETNLRQASKKLDQARLADALEQMGQYEDAVAFAVTKAWIAVEAGDALLVAADGVIGCLQAIGQ